MRSRKTKEEVLGGFERGVPCPTGDDHGLAAVVEGSFRLSFVRQILAIYTPSLVLQHRHACLLVCDGRSAKDIRFRGLVIFLRGGQQRQVVVEAGQIGFLHGGVLSFPNDFPDQIDRLNHILHQQGIMFRAEVF
ncbi:MAG: hypothetical protein RLY31_752 [Bacteroidota bacterium]